MGRRPGGRDVPRGTSRGADGGSPPSDPARRATRLTEAARTLGVALLPETAARLVAFAAELVRWSPRVDLVGPATLDTVLDRHVLDSLAALPVLRALGVRRLLDLGSGAGLPGLVLAAAAPDLDVVSVEPRGRRAAFQRHAARLLGLRNVRVVEARVVAGAAPVEPADAVVARAVVPLPELAALAAGLVRPGGVLLAMQGPAEGAPEAIGDLALEATHRYALPGEAPGACRARTLLVYRKRA